MRDKNFVANHRGGLLTLEHHRLLAEWGAECAGHVVKFFAHEYPNDVRPLTAIKLARAWARGEISVGDARASSLEAHVAARIAAEDCSIFSARSAGHAAATAHMADHALSASIYALKAVAANSKNCDVSNSVATEFDWQLQHLPDHICQLVMSGLECKLPIQLRRLLAFEPPKAR